VASHFQNRLVGISILVASVVIFLPSIIDGKKMSYEDEFIATPIHPELKAHSQSALSETDVKEQDERVRQVPVEDDQWQVEEVVTVAPITQQQVVQSTVKKASVKPAIVVAKQAPVKKKAMPEQAWTIQLGAFQNMANINSLLKTLHKAGYQAHTVPAEVIDGKLTRLFVGPDVSKENLEKQLPRLKRLTKLEGKLMPFDAVNP